jgi:hypothetical protein
VDFLLDFLKLIIVSIEYFIRKVYNESGFVHREAFVGHQVVALGFCSENFWGFNKGRMVI